MAPDPAEARRLAYADYRARERAASDKHEFVAGEVFAMAGGRRAHNLVAVNVARALGNALAERPCLVFNSDMRVRTADESGLYPDVSVVCEPPLFTDEIEDELTNPSVVVEVLSDSTEAYDREEKFEHYRSSSSLREYVRFAVRRAHVEVFTRQGDGTWSFRAYGPTDRVTLACLSCEVAVEDAYAKVFAPQS